MKALPDTIDCYCVRGRLMPISLQHKLGVRVRTAVT